MNRLLPKKNETREVPEAWPRQPQRHKPLGLGGSSRRLPATSKLLPAKRGWVCRGLAEVW